MKIGGNPEKAIELIDNAISLRKQRAIASGDKKSIEYVNSLFGKSDTMNHEEEVVFNKIKEHLTRMNLSYKTQPTKPIQFNFNDKWNSLLDKYGKKAIVNYFIESQMILGVPFLSFTIVVMLSCILFIFTANFVSVLLIAPLFHMIAFFEDKRNHEKRRKEKIRKIISGDFKIFS